MILCECGEPLVEELDTGSLTVEGEEIPFRRTSDFVACAACGEIRSVTSLRAEAVAQGQLVVDDDDQPRPDTPLQAAAEEAIAAILAMAGGDASDDVDIVFTALSDLSREDETT